MSKINMQQVKELRERTQAGLNDCRSALMESEGDMDKAIEIILKKGLAKSAKRAGAAANEGLVNAQVDSAHKSGVMVEVNIQTDFAARNEDFVAFANKVLEAAVGAKEGADLSEQKYPGTGQSIEDARKALVGKLGENITVRRWARLQVEGSGRVTSYVHMGGKIGVLLSAKTGTDEAASNQDVEKFLDDVAMQIAAMNPLYLNTAEVPAAEKKKQSDIYDAQLAEEGKPEKVRPKIIEGKLAKWAKEVCLLEQPSVLETEKSIDQLRKELEQKLSTTLEISRFVRFERGEGVEKPKGDDFASEVAKMTAN